MRTYPHDAPHQSLDPMRLVFPNDPNLVMDPSSASGEDRIFELIAYNGCAHRRKPLGGPESYLKLDYREPYRTNDLFKEVGEVGSGDYVLLGRRDDVLLARNGLNVSASGIEAAIEGQDARIAKVCMVGGQGKGGLALLVEMVRG